MKVSTEVRDFNLEHIFECGQCFRWSREDDGSYTGIAHGKIVNMSLASNPEHGGEPFCGTLTIDNAGERDLQDIWRDYLDLDRDYGKIKRRLAKSDPLLARAVRCGGGIRILRQEPWETLISFIISANNNIPRIQKNIEALASGFGEKAGTYRGRTYYNLPSPQVLANLREEDLSSCKLGYRARYLIRTAAQVCEEGISRERLLSYCGVGQKVADCVSLFSMDGFECFPIDTWVRKVMHDLYGFDEADTKGIAKYAREHFGAYGGYAQQYLFYYIRNQRGDF